MQISYHLNKKMKHGNYMAFHSYKLEKNYVALIPSYKIKKVNYIG